MNKIVEPHIVAVIENNQPTDHQRCDPRVRKLCPPYCSCLCPVVHRVCAFSGGPPVPAGPVPERAQWRWDGPVRHGDGGQGTIVQEAQGRLWWCWWVSCWCLAVRFAHLLLVCVCVCFKWNKCCIFFKTQFLGENSVSHSLTHCCFCVCFKCFSTKSLLENSECLVWAMLQQAASEQSNPVLCVFSLWGSLWVEVVELAHKNVWCGREEPVSLINWLRLYSTVLFSILEQAHCAFGHMWFWMIDCSILNICWSDVPTALFGHYMAGAMRNCCHLSMFCVHHTNFAPCHVTLCKAHT